MNNLSASAHIGTASIVFEGTLDAVNGFYEIQKIDRDMREAGQATLDENQLHLNPDVADGRALFFHEYDHIYRSSTTTLGCLFRSAEFLKQHLFIDLACWDLNGKAACFIGDEHKNLLELYQDKEALADAVISLSSFQTFLTDGAKHGQVSKAEHGAGILRTFFAPHIKLSKIPFDHKAMVDSHDALYQHLKHEGDDLDSLIHQGMRPLFEWLADKASLAKANALPNRGDIALGGGLTARDLYLAKQKNAYDAFHEKWTSLTAEVADSLGSAAHQLYFNPYSQMDFLLGCCPAYYASIFNFPRHDRAYKYGNWNKVPLEALSSVEVSLNPPIIREGQLCLEDISSLNELDSSHRFFRLLPSLSDADSFTELEFCSNDSFHTSTKAMRLILGEDDRAVFNTFAEVGSLYKKSKTRNDISQDTQDSLDTNFREAADSWVFSTSKLEKLDDFIDACQQDPIRQFTFGSLDQGIEWILIAETKDDKLSLPWIISNLIDGWIEAGSQSGNIIPFPDYIPTDARLKLGKEQILMMISQQAPI